MNAGLDNLVGQGKYKDDNCPYKGLDCYRYDSCEECTKDRLLLEQENVREINE